MRLGDRDVGNFPFADADCQVKVLYLPDILNLKVVSILSMVTCLHCSALPSCLPTQESFACFALRSGTTGTT